MKTGSCFVLLGHYPPLKKEQLEQLWKLYPTEDKETHSGGKEEEEE